MMSPQGPDLVSLYLEGPHTIGPLSYFHIIDMTFEAIVEPVFTELFRILRQFSNYA